eukprot:TRINITY_DN1309_c0_g1_i3.p1 TRINITY_DN1309_c0_g1~~TRINITY_DN1309_c0_g1_i3.p1  ORF type:complete len:492 (-),score=163.53 TRINITY_DN1309_c0_g1_i3:79-1554(-)
MAYSSPSIGRRGGEAAGRGSGRCGAGAGEGEGESADLAAAWAEVLRERAELDRRTRSLQARERELCERDLLSKGAEAKHRFWQREVSELRGRLATAEAELQKERQQRAVHEMQAATAATGAGREAAAVASLRSELLRRVGEKDSQLKRQRLHFESLLSGEQQRHAEEVAELEEVVGQRTRAVGEHVAELERDLAEQRLAAQLRQERSAAEVLPVSASTSLRGRIGGCSGAVGREGLLATRRALSAEPPARSSSGAYSLANAAASRFADAAATEAQEDNSCAAECGEAFLRRACLRLESELQRARLDRDSALARAAEEESLSRAATLGRSEQLSRRLEAERRADSEERRAASASASRSRTLEESWARSLQRWSQDLDAARAAGQAEGEELRRSRERASRLREQLGIEEAAGANLRAEASGADATCAALRGELRTLGGERDRLIEVTNGLRSELRRVQIAPSAPAAPVAAGTLQLPERVTDTLRLLRQQRQQE